MRPLKFRRKRQFVSGRIQGRLMLHLGAYWLLYHLFLWFAMFLYRYAQVRTSLATPHVSQSVGEIYAEFSSQYALIPILALVTLPVILLDMMKMTHRVAGPLVRFQNVLRDLTAGKHVPPVKLRRGDLLNEFQDEFNKYLAHLENERRQVQSMAAEARVAHEVDDLSRQVQDAARCRTPVDAVAPCP